MEIRPPEILTWPEIQKRADEYRSRFIDPPDLIPVPVERIVEIDLGIRINPIPGLLPKHDIDGFFIGSDYRVLAIDHDLYDQPRQQSRLMVLFPLLCGLDQN